MRTARRRSFSCCQDCSLMDLLAKRLLPSLLLHPSPCLPACLLLLLFFLLLLRLRGTAGASTRCGQALTGNRKEAGERGGSTRPRWPALNALCFPPPHLHKQNAVVVFFFFFPTLPARFLPSASATLGIALTRSTSSHLQWLYILSYYYFPSKTPARLQLPLSLPPPLEKKIKK